MHDREIDLATLPKLDEKKVKLEWSKDWWDGPMNGVATYEGSRCWFEFHNMDEDGVEYSYVLYHLPQDQQCILEDWHATDQRWHSTFTERHATKESTPEAQEFLAEWRKHSGEFPYPKLGPPLGRFVSGKNPSFYAIKLS